MRADLAQYAGWQFTMFLPACVAFRLLSDQSSITSGVGALLVAFCYPETLYVRHPDAVYVSSTQPIISRLTVVPRAAPTRRLKISSFGHPFAMFRYPVVVLCALYYGVCFTLGSVLPALTTSKNMNAYYGFVLDRRQALA